MTIRDVARTAGVSTTTASDSLSGAGRLPAETRQRVAAVAAELGYTANSAAQRLRTGRAGAIGLYLPGRVIGLEFYMNLASGAAEAALERGVALTLIPGRRDARVAALQMDGVIIVDPGLGDPVLRELGAQGIPSVTTERDLSPDAHHVGRVAVEHPAALRELLNHLRAQGAERPALIASDTSTSWGYDLRKTFKAWCRARRVPGVIADVPLLSYPDDIARATRQLLEAATAPDAIVCAIDGGAPGAVQAVKASGRTVPGDVMIASCVDSMSLKMADPPITALDVQPMLMGRLAADSLISFLNGDVESEARHVVDASLIRRASTSRRTEG